MAHVGQEHRLHLRRLLGLLLGDGQLLLLRDQLLLLREQLLLRLRQLVRLLLELARLLLRLLEQLAGPNVPREDLHAQRDDRQQLLDQRRLLRRQGTERCELHDAERLPLRDEGPGDDGRGRRRPEPRRDAEVVRGQIGQGNGLAIPRALADEAVAERERRPGRLALAQAVAGDQLHALLGGVDPVNRCDATAERRHQAREHALAQIGERRRALQLGRDPRGVGLDPALLLHGGGAALEDLHRPREGSRLVDLVREGHGLGEVALRDRLDRRLQPVQRPDDASIRHKAEGGRQGEGEQHRQQ